MPLISLRDRTVPVTVQARSPQRPADVFDHVAPIDITQLFVPWGPIPGVDRVDDAPPTWDAVGASRRPHLSDGTSPAETLTEYDAGRSFAYELTGFTNVLGRLCSGVRGEWTFTPDGDGTLVRWTYEFLPRRGRRALVRTGFAPVWRRYMERVLARAMVVVGSPGWPSA